MHGKLIKFAGGNNANGCTNYYDVDINFWRQIVIVENKTYSDILSAIGGIKSAIHPLFSILTPFAVLIFLYQLAGIIREHNIIHYRN